MLLYGAVKKEAACVWGTQCGGVGRRHTLECIMDEGCQLSPGLSHSPARPQNNIPHTIIK